MSSIEREHDPREVNRNMGETIAHMMEGARQEIERREVFMLSEAKHGDSAGVVAYTGQIVKTQTTLGEQVVRLVQKGRRLLGDDFILPVAVGGVEDEINEFLRTEERWRQRMVEGAASEDLCHERRVYAAREWGDLIQEHLALIGRELLEARAIR